VEFPAARRFGAGRKRITSQCDSSVPAFVDTCPLGHNGSDLGHVQERERSRRDGRTSLNIIRVHVQKIALAARTLLGTGHLQVRQTARNLSIGLRLGISFGAVAILAIAANLTVEHGASVIQTTMIFGPSRIVRETPRVALAPPTPVPIPAAIPESPEMTPLDNAELLDALAQFDRSLLLRAQAATSENKVLLAATEQRLARETASFISKAATGSAGAVRSLAAQVRTLRATGDALINASDARRAAFTSYWSHFDAVDRPLKSALDRNWTIFGRVIARQSLLTLSRELDDIRRRAGQMTAAGGYEPTTLSALADSERRFSTTLEQNTAGLTRSQGKQWVEQLRNELSEAVSSRSMLASADRQATVTLGAFEQSVSVVGNLARTAAERSRKPEAPKIPAATLPTAAVTPTGTNQAVSASAPAPVLSTRIYTHQTSTDFATRARALIAAISGGVLLLLLFISIATVRSIVLPIRQFMATTGRLATGDAAARFERGGVREIDSLAASLNEMASTLEAAQAITREYQGALEVRIEDRSRQLQYLAEHDLVTGLPNRRQLIKHLEEVLQPAAATRAPVAVFFFDLDNFKNINDTMGHRFGDRVLQAVATRLSRLTALEAFAARLGGDEFSVVDCNCESIEQVIQRGTAFVNAFQSPLTVEGRELLVSISVGASVYPEHETSAEALLSAADAALFHAKSLGRNQLELFSRDLLKRVSERYSIEQGLRRALDRNEFELVFQPEVNFDLGGIKLVEALLRWRLPDSRRISPMQFLPVAQESGLIVPIGDWVLRSAIESAAKWHHSSWPEVRVAINVTASQLLSTDFAQRVQRLLFQHKLPPRCIEIELTETVLQTGSAIIDTLRELREFGIGVALDDFGTGFSSLASLQHLPLTRVKLDQSLVAGIDRDPRALAIAQAITDLCEKLGLEVTAEGIERPEQLRILLEHRSMCLQGFLISCPIEADSVAAAVANMPEQMQSLFLAASVNVDSGRSLALVAAPDTRGTSPDIEQRISDGVMS
jgi:diguanylate cyclase (GGDEF)-like protein